MTEKGIQLDQLRFGRLTTLPVKGINKFENGNHQTLLSIRRY